jgi:phosphatidylserine synthase
MKSFFPMRRGEGATLVFLVAFAAFAFVPAWRTVELWGMAVFGWLIAALMIVSPALALATFLAERGGRRAREDSAGDVGTGPGGGAP